MMLANTSYTVIHLKGRTVMDRASSTCQSGRLSDELAVVYRWHNAVTRFNTGSCLTFSVQNQILVAGKVSSSAR